jgi:hypothetical protein
MGDGADDADIDDVFRGEAEAAEQTAMAAQAAAAESAGAAAMPPLSESEQRYREQWRVLAATDKVRREMAVRERQLEKENRALQQQLAELRAAWMADRASTPAVSHKATEHAELESLRTLLAVTQRENDTLRHQLAQRPDASAAPAVAGPGAAADAAAELRRIDALAEEITAIMRQQPSLQQQQQQQQQKQQQAARSVPAVAVAGVRMAPVASR